jgi:Flp pilus assembly protein TadD
MNGYVMNDSGQAYYKKGDYAMARKEFQRAAIDNPKNAHYLYNLASAQRKQGDVASAEQTFRRAIELDPAHQPSYHGLADLMVSQGRQPEAEALLTTWAGSQPYKAEPNIEVAWIKSQSGDLDGAELALQDATRVNPRNHIAVAQLGDLYERKGQYQSASALYQRSLYMNPAQTSVRSRLATIRDAHPDVVLNQQQIANSVAGVPMTAVNPMYQTASNQYPVQYQTAYPTADPLFQQASATPAGISVIPQYTYPQSTYPQNQVGYNPAMMPNYNVTGQPQMMMQPQMMQSPVIQQQTVYATPDPMMMQGTNQYRPQTMQYMPTTQGYPQVMSSNPVYLGQPTGQPVPFMANADPAHMYDDGGTPVVNPF